MIKAISYLQQTGWLRLADDSGLEIDALGGRPGVISSHYSSSEARDGRPARGARHGEQRQRARARRRARRSSRPARFVCVMVLAGPDRATRPLADAAPVVLAMTRGTFEGRIGLPGLAEQGGVPRGVNGFGYDPLFLVGPDYAPARARTSPTVEKNKLSHRAAAAKGAMAEQLRTLC